MGLEVFDASGLDGHDGLYDALPGRESMGRPLPVVDQGYRLEVPAKTEAPLDEVTHSAQFAGQAVMAGVEGHLH